MNAWSRWVWVVAVGLLGCGGSSARGVDEIEGDTSAGGELSAYEGPIASTDVEGGKVAFDNFCGDCHPDGGEDVGPSLIDHPHTPGRLRQQIREGSGKMRPFSEKRLSDEQLEAILAWLATVHAVK